MSEHALTGAEKSYAIDALARMTTPHPKKLARIPKHQLVTIGTETWTWWRHSLTPIYTKMSHSTVMLMRDCGFATHLCIHREASGTDSSPYL